MSRPRSAPVLVPRRSPGGALFGLLFGERKAKGSERAPGQPGLSALGEQSTHARLELANKKGGGFLPWLCPRCAAMRWGSTGSRTLALALSSPRPRGQQGPAEAVRRWDGEGRCEAALEALSRGSTNSTLVAITFPRVWNSWSGLRDVASCGSISFVGPALARPALQIRSVGLRTRGPSAIERGQRASGGTGGPHTAEALTTTIELLWQPRMNGRRVGMGPSGPPRRRSASGQRPPQLPPWVGGSGKVSYHNIKH